MGTLAGLVDRSPRLAVHHHLADAVARGGQWGHCHAGSGCSLWLLEVELRKVVRTRHPSVGRPQLSGVPFRSTCTTSSSWLGCGRRIAGWCRTTVPCRPCRCRRRAVQLAARTGWVWARRGWRGWRRCWGRGRCAWRSRRRWRIGTRFPRDRRRGGWRRRRRWCR